MPPKTNIKRTCARRWSASPGSPVYTAAAPTGGTVTLRGPARTCRRGGAAVEHAKPIEGVDQAARQSRPQVAQGRRAR